MATRTKFALKQKDRESYLKLVMAFPLASIKSDEHLAEAQKVMDRILGKGDLDDGEEMYLDALSDLVAAYELFTKMRRICCGTRGWTTTS